MPNYQNGKIYSLRSHQTDDIYIGSTTLSLSLRKAGHRNHYKRHLDGEYHFVTSFNITKFDDCYIELIENYPCNSRNELEKREGELIREMDCINKYIAGRTIKEYREANKEAIAEYQKKYRDENKEVLKEYREANKERLKEYREANKEVLAGYQKEYREANKEAIAEYQKKYRDENKGQIKEYQAANKEKIAEKQKAYYVDNREAISEYQKAYYVDNKEQIAEQKKVTFTCDCGSVLTHCNKSRHEKSKKHREYMNT
jgi:hypothetical protein